MYLPPERLGSFYLGAKYDLQSGKITNEPINYDARDLTTHAICLGMTGSGKTGLCVCLLEEAALDNIPAIIIDPKGDITNLLLQFPNLASSDFEAWVNVDDARRKGKTVSEYAIDVAETWRKGLADWGIAPERISKLRDSVDYTIFTPGSEAGVPVSILSSLASPGLDFDKDGESARELIGGVVAALLDLMGQKADPVRSPEAILLSNIFEHYWSRGEDLSLEKLITSVQKPPFSKLGVFDVDSFYPAKERFQFAISMNSLIASPSFSSWLRGEALNVDKLLYSASGRPRHSIFYLAHLSDSERMFFTTLLLGSILTWVRRQQGTTSLRAILYFDEVFGFMPPVAEPSSKRPLMTLLKQARATGLGVTLVTQNPVDIDYKGLTNTGTWFIGKLQAERDKLKVIEGLKGAVAESGGVGGETDYGVLINRLTSRVFLLHDIHQGPPVVFHSRWAMSYLRGPLTKPQIGEIMKPRRQTTVQADISRVQPDSEMSAVPPSLDPKITQVFIDNPIPEEGIVGFNQTILETSTSAEVVYVPRLAARVTIGYFDKKLGIDRRDSKLFLLSVDDPYARWEKAQILNAENLKLSSLPIEGACFSTIPSQYSTAEKIQAFGRALPDYIALNSRLKVFTHSGLNIHQKQGEDERAFAIRIRDAAKGEKGRRSREDTEGLRRQDRKTTGQDNRFREGALK